MPLRISRTFLYTRLAQVALSTIIVKNLYGALGRQATLTTQLSWLFAFGFIVALLSILVSSHDIKSYLSRRTSHNKYGQLGSYEDFGGFPTWRLHLDCYILILWMISACMKLVSLDMECDGLVQLEYAELLLYAVSCCLIERDIHRIRLKAVPIEKARSFSAGDVNLSPNAA